MTVDLNFPFHNMAFNNHMGFYGEENFRDHIEADKNPDRYVALVLR